MIEFNSTPALLEEPTYITLYALPELKTPELIKIDPVLILTVDPVAIVKFPFVIRPRLPLSSSRVSLILATEAKARVLEVTEFIKCFTFSVPAYVIVPSKLKVILPILTVPVPAKLPEVILTPFVVVLLNTPLTEKVFSKPLNVTLAFKLTVMPFGIVMFWLETVEEGAVPPHVAELLQSPEVTAVNWALETVEKKIPSAKATNFKGDRFFFIF